MYYLFPTVLTITLSFLHVNLKVNLKLVNIALKMKPILQMKLTDQSKFASVRPKHVLPVEDIAHSLFALRCSAIRVRAARVMHRWRDFDHNAHLWMDVVKAHPF